MKTGLEADTSEAIGAAARYVIAVLLAGRNANVQIDLDDARNTFKGRARYLERKMAGDDISVSNNAESIATSLVSNPTAGFNSTSRNATSRY